MFQKLNTAMKSAAILSLVLIFALSAALATINYYSSSKVYHVGEGSEFVVFEDNDGEVDVGVPAGSLDDYLEEQDLDEVEISVQMSEELVQCADGTQYYKLDFTFSPSGCYFDPPLELDIEGKYVETGCEVTLYDEDGEELEADVSSSGDELEYEIPHFSSYYYDDYDY